MTVMVRSNGHRRATKAQLFSENRQLVESLDFMEEQIAELEMALDDEGWQRLTFESNREFSSDGLRKIINLCRLHYIKNPLVNRAVEIQRYYVFAQGVEIAARDPGRNVIAQGFLMDRGNINELFGHQARGLKEVTLQTEANIFFALFTEPTTGRVRVRTIPVDDMLAGDIVTNPDDRREVWYYKRTWQERTFDVATGKTEWTPRTAYYPDWLYEPEQKPEQIGEHKVFWDAPVYHLKVGGLEGMRFGIPEIYSGIDWARAIKEDLEDYATIKRALARFAWNLTLKGGPKTITAAKNRLGTGLGSGEPDTNPAPTVAATWIANEAAKLSPIKTAGAQATPEEGMRLWYMFSAAVGIPETMIAGDADSGNLATAKTLDRPTELKFLDRQTLWSHVYRDLIGYALRKSTSATPITTPPAIPEIVPDPGGENDPSTVVDETIDVTFPPILEHDLKPWIDGVLAGLSARMVPPREAARMIMAALGVDDIDEILEIMFPGDANAVVPYEPPPTPAEQLAAQTQKPGGPPAAAADRVHEAIGEFRATLQTVIDRREARAVAANEGKG